MKYSNYYLLFLFGVALNASGGNLHKIGSSDNRSGRWFLFPRTVTKWISAKSVITESIPSSCVVVQPSLAPCRHVRQLSIQPSTTVRILQTEAVQLPLSENLLSSSSASAGKFFSSNNYFQVPSLFSSRGGDDDAPVSTLYEGQDEEGQGQLQLQQRRDRHKPLSWSEYFFGFNDRNADVENDGVLKTGPIRTTANNKTADEYYNNYYNNGGVWYNLGGFLEPDVTITRTAIKSVTAKYLDPKTVVTFSVKGCHPSKLPFNLPLCDTTSANNALVNDSSNSSSISTPNGHSSISKDVHYAPN